MKVLKNIFLVFILLLTFSIIVSFTCTLGIAIIVLGIASGMYILPTIVGVILIYISFLNSEVINEDVNYIIQEETHTSKKITESEEDNDETETLSEKMTILKKEYSHYQGSNNNYFMREVKEQLNTVMKIQECINNLEKIAKKQVIFQIEEVWEKIRMNVVDNINQCFVYANYINLNNEFESVIVKLTQENNCLLATQEKFLNDTIRLITNKMLENKEREHRYLILELDAMQRAINNVINIY